MPNREDDAELDNTGGTSLFASFGLNLRLTQPLAWIPTFQVPSAEWPNDEQQGTDF